VRFRLTDVMKHARPQHVPMYIARTTHATVGRLNENKMSNRFRYSRLLLPAQSLLGKMITGRIVLTYMTSLRRLYYIYLHYIV